MGKLKKIFLGVIVLFAFMFINERYKQMKVEKTIREKQIENQKIDTLSKELSEKAYKNFELILKDANLTVEEKIELLKLKDVETEKELKKIILESDLKEKTKTEILENTNKIIDLQRNMLLVGVYFNEALSKLEPKYIVLCRKELKANDLLTEEMRKYLNSCIEAIKKAQEGKLTEWEFNSLINQYETAILSLERKFNLK